MGRRLHSRGRWAFPRRQADRSLARSFYYPPQAPREPQGPAEFGFRTIFFSNVAIGDPQTFSLMGMFPDNVI
jgi:hypothetical protein